MDRDRSAHVRKEGAIKCFVGNTEGKKPVGRQRRLGEDMLIESKSVGFGDIYRIYLVQDGQVATRLNTVMGLWSPSNYGEILELLHDCWLLKDDSALCS